MSRLRAHKQALYELRFSPMCKPAAEVSNLTQIESHTPRARTMMFWRIAEGIIDWGPREVELLYQSTLDSISQAFDVFEYPLSEYMLDARADVWAAGLAPENVTQAVALAAGRAAAPQAETLFLAGEIAQLGDESLLSPVRAALKTTGSDAATWITPTGSLAYALGAWDVAKTQARQVVAGIDESGAQMVIADGPETVWALTRIYPALGVDLPAGVTVKLLSVLLDEQLTGAVGKQALGKVMVHDSRPACLIADRMANNLAVLPGYVEDEDAFGLGAVYEAPRRLLDSLGAQRIFGTWTRSLAKTSGADDGLWLTYPDLAEGLAGQRLDYAERLGAEMVVTDSPLAASFLAKHGGDRELKVKLLAELVSQ